MRNKLAKEGVRPFPSTDTAAQTQTIPDETDKPDVRDISGARKPTATLVSFDRLAEFERGEAASGGRRLTRPEWLRWPDWYERAARDPRVIIASRWVTGASVMIGVLAIAYYVQATFLGTSSPAVPTPTATVVISATPTPRSTSPRAVLPVEPKLPQPPPRTSLTPERTRAKATTAPSPTKTREETSAPPESTPPVKTEPTTPPDSPKPPPEEPVCPGSPGCPEPNQPENPPAEQQQQN